MNDVLAPLEKATEVSHEGFTLQPRALTARQLAQCRAAWLPNHDRASPGYCAPGHYDVSVPEFSTADFGFLHAGAPWMSAARALLGNDCVLLAGGVVDAHPGAEAGEAHHGGAHLLEDPLPGAAAVAPHCLTVFISLADTPLPTAPLSPLSLGPWPSHSYWPRSHHGAGWSPPAADLPSPLGAKPSDYTASDGFCDVDDTSNSSCDTAVAISPVLHAGDAILVDLRLRTKALANKTLARRPILYLVLARPWFRYVKHRRDSGNSPRDSGNSSRDSGNVPRDSGNGPRDSFAQVALAVEHAPVAVGATVQLFLGGAWARGVVVEVRPTTEVYAGTPWRRSVRMGRVVMDATGEEKEGDIDELFLKGHFIVESTENVVEQVEQQQEEAAGGGEEEEEEGEEEATDNVADEAKAAEEKERDNVEEEEEKADDEAEGAESAEQEQQQAAPSDESSSDSDDDDSVDSIDFEAVAPLPVSRLARACATEFRAEGFTIASGALTAAEVAQTRAVCEEARATNREAHRLDLAPKRLDLLMPAFATAPFGFMHAHAPWMGAVRSLLGDDCYLFTGGVLFNEPGAAGSNVHLDGDHLFERPAPGATAPPPHCLTVFIPLVDVDGATNGTALWPRSHHGVGWEPPEAVSDGCTPGVGVTHRGKAAAPALRAGDALLFDFRLLHRALANGSDHVRPVVYLIIARRWFRDCDNWPDVAVSLAFSRVCLSAGVPEPEEAGSIIGTSSISNAVDDGYVLE